MFSISITYRLALWIYVICDIVSGLIPTTSTSTLDLSLTHQPTKSSPLCPASCRCSRILSSPYSGRQTVMAACDRPIHDDDRFDPETEVVRVTGNCHRSFVSVMVSVGVLSAPRELSLRRCHVYTVEQLMLASDAVNWGTVFELDVGYNLIARVDDRAFVKMSSLLTLVLSYNRIETISQDAFGGLNDLAKLDLTGNRLSMVTRADMRWLCALRSLHELNLRANWVHVLAASGFRCRLTSCRLQRLDLGENRIRRVEDDAFVGLSNVTQLHLDSNQLTTVPVTALVKLSASLEELDMNGNQMDSLLTHSFRDLSAMRVLRLNRMPTLRFVDRNSFVNLSSLERVELSGNAALKYVDRDAFLNVPNITNISLAGCALSAVDRQLVEALTSLKSVDLRLNPIDCDCHTKWMRLSNVTLVNFGVWQQCKDDPGGTGCPPRIATLFHAELDVQLTDSFSLYCRAVGYPAPQVTWSLPTSIDSNFSSTQVPVTMVTVKAASSRDAGNYTCVATNVYGTDIRSVSVNVVMPPTVILVSRLTATSITLVWKNVEHSRAYRLYYGAVSPSSNNTDWSPTDGVDLQYYMRSYTFAELLPDTPYRFCISLRPTQAGYDVASGDKDGGWSLWTVDCVEATTTDGRDVNVGLMDVRRYVIAGCAVAVGVALLLCLVGARRLCARVVDWPPELSDGGSSDRLSPTVYADSCADCDDTGTAAWDALTDEVYKNVMATSSSLISIFTAADIDEIRRTAVLSGNQAG